MEATYRGIVKGGVVVLPKDVHLADGMVVLVSPVEGETGEIEWGADPLARVEEYAEDTGIPDLASEHDYYAYGGHKRSQRKKRSGREERKERKE